MKKIIGYARVSTENQKDEGTISIQRQALDAYAKEKGFELVRVFEDNGVSGGLEDRPGLAELFAYLEDGQDIEGVSFYKLDRLARDLYIQEHLIKKLEALGVAILSTKEPDLSSDDPMRKAFRQFMGVVSELEKSFITMRLSAGRINKIKNKSGFAGGGVPLGYEAVDKDLVIAPTSSTIELIHDMKKRQRKGLREIARHLNDTGTPTARGGKWYAGTVRYILGNKIYKGIMEYSGQTATRSDLSLFPVSN